VVYETSSKGLGPRALHATGTGWVACLTTQTDAVRRSSCLTVSLSPFPAGRTPRELHPYMLPSGAA
jgi:hypothetical protein